MFDWVLDMSTQIIQKRRMFYLIFLEDYMFFNLIGQISQYLRTIISEGYC